MIRRLWAEIRFDIKGMGGTFFLPLWVSLIFLLVTVPVVHTCREMGIENTRTLPLLEIYLPMMGSIWGIFSLQDILEEPGGSIYFSYRRRRTYWGLMRQLRFLLFFALLSAVMAFVTGKLMGQSFFPWQWLLYLAQGFFLMGLGFFSMVFTGKSGYAMIVVAAYVCTHCLFDLGTLTQHTMIYLGNESMAAMAWEEISPLALRALALGAAAFVAGQLRLKYR